jgi:hypothetical protein
MIICEIFDSQAITDKESERERERKIKKSTEINWKKRLYNDFCVPHTEKVHENREILPLPA